MAPALTKQEGWLSRAVRQTEQRRQVECHVRPDTWIRKRSVISSPQAAHTPAATPAWLLDPALTRPPMPLLTLLLPTLPIPPMPRPLVESTEQSDGDGASACCRGKKMFLIQTVFFLGPLKHIWLQKRRSSLLTGLFGIWTGGKKTWPGLLSLTKTATKELLNHKCLLVKKGCRRRLLSLSSIFFFFFELPRSSCATSACVIYYIPSAGIIYIPAMPFGFFFVLAAFQFNVCMACAGIAGLAAKKHTPTGVPYSFSLSFLFLFVCQMKFL